MKYPGAEKREIIRLVGESHLPVKQTLEMLGAMKRAQVNQLTR